MRGLFIAAFALILIGAGCASEPARTCIESHSEMYMMPMYNAALKMTTLQPMWRTVCDKYEDEL